jgi:hypothetical protein
VSNLRATVLAHTPLYIDYDVPLKQRLPPFGGDIDELPRFYSNFRPALPLTGEDLRVASYGAWGGLLPEVLVNDPDFATEYRRALHKSISELTQVAEAELRSAMRAESSGFGWARTPDEGWAAAGLTGAMAIDPHIVLDACGADPAGIVPRWSLTIYLPDDFRVELVRMLVGGSAERRLCAAVHLSWMMDRGMYDATPISEDLKRAIESLPDNVCMAVLGFLLGHYLTWSRNAYAAFQLRAGFGTRMSFLAAEINRRATDADDVANAMSASVAGDVEMVAFLQGALTSAEPSAAALARGSDIFFEAFASITDDRDLRVSVLSFQSYVKLAISLPLTADAFDGIFDGLLCDEPSYLMGRGAYERDRTRAIILCAIAGLAIRERDDGALLRSVRRRLAFLSTLPAGYVPPFSEEFRRHASEASALVLPER